MGSVFHLEESKRNIVKYVHRLACSGVRIKDSLNGGMVIHHNSESSLVFEVNSNQHLEPLLMESKESILAKMNESFSQGERYF